MKSYYLNLEENSVFIVSNTYDIIVRHNLYNKSIIFEKDLKLGVNSHEIKEFEYENLLKLLKIPMPKFRF